MDGRWDEDKFKPLFERIMEVAIRIEENSRGLGNYVYDKIIICSPNEYEILKKMGILFDKVEKL